jgi:hypothetical protein
LDAQNVINQFNAKLDVYRKQILDVLNSLDIAFARKDEAEVKRLWPGKTNKGFLDSLKLPGQKMSFKSLEEPKLQGDTVATVRCTLHTDLPRPRDQIGTISLQYGGGRWVIDDLKVIQ